MNKRIRTLRRTLDLTQQDFAQRIGTTQNAVASYETGRRNPSSSVVNNICKEFHVNETWLRTGDGTMFQEVSRDEEISAFVNDVLREESDDFRRRFIAALSHLDAAGWAALEQLVEDTARRLDSIAEKPLPPAPAPPEPPPAEVDIASELAELKRQNQALAAEIAALKEEDAALAAAEERERSSRSH